MGSTKNTIIICEVCGKEWKTWNSGIKVRFCSSECHVEHKYKQYIEGWLNGETDGSRGVSQLSKYVIRWVFERAHDKCEVCGFNTRHPRTGKLVLEIHHIDENPNNNKPENLKVLCPNCHALADSKDTNKGNGRRYYQQQYYKNKVERYLSD